jgi:hypothetical protein
VPRAHPPNRTGEPRSPRATVSSRPVAPKPRATRRARELQRYTDEIPTSRPSLPALSSRIEAPRSSRSAADEVELPPRYSQSRASLWPSANCKVTPAGPTRPAAPIGAVPTTHHARGSDPRPPPSAGSAATSRAEPLQGRAAVHETVSPKELVHSSPLRGTPPTNAESPNRAGLLSLSGG